VGLKHYWCGGTSGGHRSSTDILVRFWDGVGCAFAACHALSDAKVADEPPRESAPAMRAALVGLCGDGSDGGSDVVNSFLNQLINHVNWTVSEFDQVGGRRPGPPFFTFVACVAFCFRFQANVRSTLPPRLSCRAHENG
jgi:hypothetical protein